MTISIRPATIEDSPGIGKVQLDSWRSAYATILPAEYLAQFSYEERDEDWRDLLASGAEHIIYVAENETNVIVGFAYAVPKGDDTYQSELRTLHVLPTFRGQGIGRKLIAAVARNFKARGIMSLYLDVLKENQPSRAIYEHLGGKLLGEHTIEIGKNDVTGTAAEVSYGWPNIDVLCGESNKEL